MLDHFKPLFHILRPVVAAPVCILHRVGEVRFNDVEINVQFVNQHGACTCPETVPALFFTETQRIQGTALAGEVVLTEEAYWQVADLVDVERRAPVKVKGIADEVVSYRMVGMKQLGSG